MNAEVFVDTNIFLYALSDRLEERDKAERARQLLLSENWGWSVQVAGEFYYAATSPKRPFKLPHSLAREYVENWLNFPTALLQSSTVIKALELTQRFRITYWDAASLPRPANLAVRQSIQKISAMGRIMMGSKLLIRFVLSAQPTRTLISNRTVKKE